MGERRAAPTGSVRDAFAPAGRRSRSRSVVASLMAACRWARAPGDVGTSCPKRFVRAVASPGRRPTAATITSTRSTPTPDPKPARTPRLMRANATNLDRLSRRLALPERRTRQAGSRNARVGVASPSVPIVPERARRSDNGIKMVVFRPDERPERHRLGRPLRSGSLQEPQTERREHEDNPDVGHQALPEPVSEEQDIHADYDGYQRKHVKPDACLLPVAAPYRSCTPTSREPGDSLARSAVARTARDPAQRGPWPDREHALLSYRAVRRTGSRRRARRHDDPICGRRASGLTGRRSLDTSRAGPCAAPGSVLCGRQT